MRRVLGILSLMVAGAGLLIALFPLISVWRVSGSVLAELPDVQGPSINTDRNRLALFDDDFVLATRTYEGLSGSDLKQVLLREGFRILNARGEVWLSKPCCGDYDAVWVRIDEVGPDTGLAVVTVADSDEQVAWPLISWLGLSVIAVGLAGALAALTGAGGGRQRQPDPPRVDMAS
ncbi:MAG: hypothetical protein GY773_25480 [Actinomycetia bacterium]|nr:hypothetical protein [Actinomycetes bacterium]